MITCRRYHLGVLKEQEFDPARVSDMLQDPGARVWLDLTEPSEEELDLIQEEFGLHPLAIEDAHHRGQRSKVEIYGSHFFVVVHGMALDPNDELLAGEIHVFAGKKFLITVRYPPVFDLTPVLTRWDRQAELTEEGAGFLMYALLDEVVDGYFVVIDRFEVLSDDLEDRVFADRPDPDIQQAIFNLKRRLISFRRLILPLREVLDLMQEQSGFVTPALGPYYRDVADHVVRTIEFTDNLREILTSALEAQLSQVSFRLNEVIKKLTSWAAIILVPTLIAGIYGMNFEHMPEIHWLVGYPLALSLMAGSALLLYRMFKRRDML
jgi:magnesium transporter